jgi:Na+-translocating ferredoxin:NAD+ oxidoreductase subunit A
MSSLLVILIGTVLVNTFLLMKDDAAVVGSRAEGSVASAIRVACASSIALVLASSLSSALWPILPRVPQDTLFFVYALVVVTVTFGVDRLARAQMPRLARALAISPILAVSNSLALGAPLLNTMATDIALTILYSFLLGVTFIGMLALFIALVLRIVEREVPAVFRFAPIAFISAGLLTLALMGFTGLLRG